MTSSFKTEWLAILERTNEGERRVFSRGFFKVGTGICTSFWEDTWINGFPLAEQYPMLYNIAHRKQVLVASSFPNGILNITFRRTLIGNKWDKWLELVHRIRQVNITNEHDIFIWRLTVNGSFSVKSIYVDLLNEHTKYLRKYIWKMKVPLKIKIFMWFLHRKVILTKHNLIKRNWNGNKSCSFCEREEYVHHLFFDCPFAKTIWRIVHMSFSLTLPKNITNLFGNWINGTPKKELKLIRVGVLYRPGISTM